MKNVQDSIANILASYNYDASGLITKIQFGNGNKTEYHYDGAGRMTGLIHSDTADTFANYHALLDDAGYPVRITGMFTDSSVADTGNVSYTYDSLGTRLSSFGGTSMTYDFEGQTTTKGVQSCSFNVRHQMDTVTGSGYQYQYTYDESGHRVKAIRNGVTTKYIYGGGSRILTEADSNGAIKRYYIYGHGLLGFYVLGTGFFACHYDMSGNMIAITDDTGAVAAEFAYTPFGEVVERTIGNPICDVPVGFAGEYGILREPNGLYYMNARYYDPSMGRFLSEDPAGLGGGDLTLYSYAGNNPVVFVDPSGLCGQSTQRRPGINVDLNLSGIHQDYILNATAAEPLTKGNAPQSFNDLGGVSVRLNIGYTPQTGDYYTEFSLGLSDYLGVTAGRVHNLKDYYGEEAGYFRINFGVGLPILPIPFSAESGVKQ